MPWIDPQQTAPDEWSGESAGQGDSVKSVYERAHETAVPFGRDEAVRLHGAAVTDEFRSREYTHAHVSYHLAVERDGRVKLMSNGHLWGGGEDHQRFRAQYRRDGEPTDTEPFEAYRVWRRYQYGTVGRAEGGGLTFEADSPVQEDTSELEWLELYSTAQLRIAELELVRNPPYARHLLVERGRWDSVRDAFTYNPYAFAVGP